MKNKAKILAVDDEPKNVKLLEALLVPQGYEVTTALNGKEALQLIEKNEIDLVMLDIMMPECDGFEVTRRLRSQEKTQLIPIMLITSLTGSEERTKGIEAGCDDFISKPFDKNEVFARVKSLLKIKSLHDELKENYEKLKELENMRDGLTHMIIHDLKGQLSVLSLNMEMLEVESQEKLTQEEKQNLKAMFVSSQVLKDMINDLLDINKMEEGKMKLVCERLNIGDTVKDVAELMKVVAQSSGKGISIEISESIPEVLFDKALIKRVISNLVSNGIKFTSPNGSVHVKVFLNTNDNHCHVQIKDEGKGIPKEYLNRVFDKFVQLEGARGRAGHGLGLTFCKMAVEAHGGRIWVENAPNMGGIFTFTLPIFERKLTVF